MQNTAGGVGAEGAVHYRERLAPSLWAMVAAAVVAPMAALVLAPIDTTAALAAGAAVGLAVIGIMIAGAPVITVSDSALTAGRARIVPAWLGEPQTFAGEDARIQRGAALNPRAWHVIRGGIDGVVVVAVTDPDDPTPYWVVSSRTPDRLAAALRRARYAAHSVQMGPAASS